MCFPRVFKWETCNDPLLKMHEDVRLTASQLCRRRDVPLNPKSASHWLGDFEQGAELQFLVLESA